MTRKCFSEEDILGILRQIELGSYNSAKKTLRKILRESESSTRIKLLYIECLIREKNYKTATREASRLSKGEESNDVRLSEVRAYAEWNKFEVAIKKVKKIIQTYSSDAEAYSMYGIMLNQQDKVDEAILAIEKAVALSPKNIKFHFDLAQLYIRDYRNEDAKSTLRKVIEIDSQNYDALRQISEIEFKENDYESAIETIQSALTIQDIDQELYSMFIHSLAVNGRIDEAIKVANKCVETSHGFIGFIRDSAFVNCIAERIEETFELIKTMKEYPSEVVEALAIEIAILNKLGRHEEAGQLTQLDKLVKAEVALPPERWSTLESFNSDVTNEILNHNQLSYTKSNITLVDEQCTPHLTDGPKNKILDGLLEIFEIGAQSYINEIQKDVDCPPEYLAIMPQNYRIECWANVMNNGGNHKAHHHRRGWLSGVYYPCLPSSMVGQDSKSGALELGCSFYEFRPAKNETTRIIVPQEGTLILFPSYVGHQTIPIQSEAKPRISMAFNLVSLD